MKVEKVNHVVILVRDLEKAGKFFADLFGIEFDAPRELKNVDVLQLKPPPEKEKGIHLITPLSPGGPTGRLLERKGEGMVTLDLKVTNIEEAIADMESHGVRLITRFATPQLKVALFHPKDIYGVAVELLEY